MLKLEIMDSKNRNLDDFVYIDEIVENKNGVIDIYIKSDRFKYWDISSQSGCSIQGTAMTINNMVHYKKETLYVIDDWYKVDEDEMEFETFCFDIIFDKKERNDWQYYKCFISPLKWEYQIKLVPKSLIETYDDNIELDWEEIVIIDEEEENEN